jgi:hypothetical protein
MIKTEEIRHKGYAAVVVVLKDFVILPNCDNVKSALVFGNSIIVSKAAQVGEIGLYFPVETALSKEFLGHNNQFRKSEFGNVDPEKKGFFEEHGRVRAMKFRGHKSEGFYIPIASLAYTGLPLTEFTVGMEFDRLGDKEICAKYIPRRNKVQGPGGNRQGRQARAEDRIVQGQFRFHIDTENLRRNVHQIYPKDFISISEKLHGTSAIFSNVLVKRELRWFERILKALGVKIQETEYGYIWSSRRVIKGVDGQEKANSIHYYDTDIWGIVAREIQERVPKSYTIYAEILGFTPEGSPIQKGYHYGCEVGSHKTVVYRITVTNPDGKVIELGWKQVKKFCMINGLEMVPEHYFGRADSFYPLPEGLRGDAHLHNKEEIEDWQRGFLAKLERTYVSDQMCLRNRGEVPAEGVVVKVEKFDEALALKLKNFKFLEWETAQLNEGVVDIETEQSEVPDAGEKETV